MTGSVFKVMLALDGEPRFRAAHDASENSLLLRSGFRTAPTVSSMDQAYHEAVRGEWSREPIIWGAVPSALDHRLAPPGKHVMSLTVFHAPAELQASNWTIERDRFGQHVIKYLTDHYIPNLSDLVIGHRFLSPEDFEASFGLVQGNLAGGDVIASRMFDMRPMAGCSDYATPVKGLYLCGVSTWPAMHVSVLPGHNAARKVIQDRQLRLRTTAVKG
jgi:phytoene dehydrogenase-like protein